MKSSAVVAAVAFAVSGVYAQTFMINTPTSLVQCLPALLTWTGGQAPFFLTVVPGGQPGASPLVDLGQQSGNSVTWTVNVAQGTSVGLDIRDSTGVVAQSGTVIVQNSTNSTCVGQTAQTASGSGGQTAGGSGSTGGSTGATSAGTTGGAAATSTKPSSSGSASGTASGSATSPSSGASKIQLSIAGAVGAAALAFFL